MNNSTQLESQIVENKNSNKFLEFISKEYINNFDNRKELINSLSELHNQEELNLFQDFLTLQNTPTGQDFWMTINIIEEAFAMIEIKNITEALDCINHLINEAGDDMASHTIMGKFEDKLGNDVELLEKTLGEYLKNPEIYQKFTGCIILAGSKCEFKKYLDVALILLKNKSQQVKCRAAYILGELDYKTDDVLHKAINALLSVGKDELDDKLLSNVLHAYIKILYEHPSLFDESADKNIKKMLAKSDILTFYSISKLLLIKNSNENIKAIEITKKLYGYLKDEKASQVGTVNNIGFAFPKNDRDKLILSYLQLIEYHLENNMDFEHFHITHSILKDLELFQKIITRWLALNSPNIARATKDFFQLDDKKRIQPDFELVNSNYKYLNYFIARKAIGFLLHQPHVLVHFLIELMDVSSDEISTDIADHIFFFILLNYPAIEEDITNLGVGLKQHTKGELQRIGNQLNTYIENLKSIPAIKELRPPTEHILAYNKKQADMIANSYEEANKNSLAGLFQNVTMLYGSKPIIRHENSDGSVTTSEATMSSHSYSVAVPRMIHIDNDNLEYELKRCRIERFRDEVDH